MVGFRSRPMGTKCGWRWRESEYFWGLFIGWLSNYCNHRWFLYLGRWTSCSLSMNHSGVTHIFASHDISTALLTPCKVLPNPNWATIESSVAFRVTSPSPRKLDRQTTRPTDLRLINPPYSRKNQRLPVNTCGDSQICVQSSIEHLHPDD